jgi:NADH-quinone oxidoreductase subunit J
VIVLCTFAAIALGMLALGFVVALSHDIIRSAFALLGVMLGVAGLFGLLGVDFLAVVQIMIYVGGIMILFLFAVMFTNRIADVAVTNRAVGRLPAALLCIGILAMLLMVIWTYPFAGTVDQGSHTTAALGAALTGRYVIVLEAMAVLIPITLIGAVAIARPQRPGVTR